MRALAMPAVGPGEWITPRPLDQATVAIVSTAGLHQRAFLFSLMLMWLCFRGYRKIGLFGEGASASVMTFRN